MRKTFRGYYRPTKEEFSKLWETCIFSFDANILLDIYRFSQEGRKKFLRILKAASDRIIIPYQAAKEYQNKRLNVIKDQEDAYDKIIEILQKSLNTNEKKLNSFKKHPSIKVENIISDLKILYNALNSNLKEKQKNHPKLFNNDYLREELTDLLTDEKIGKPYTQEEMKKIQKDCEYRFKNKIPPGYKDSSKKENKCGDLILWHQLIDIAKEKKQPIIFVTGDHKEDWWWKPTGKTAGPHPELIEEMYNKAKVHFYMYKTDQFIKFATKYFFEEKVDPQFMEEVKNVMYEGTPDITLTIDQELDIGSLQSNLRRYYVALSNEIFHVESGLNEIKNGKYIIKFDFDEIRGDLKDINNNFKKYVNLNRTLRSKLSNNFVDAPSIQIIEKLKSQIEKLKNEENELRYRIARLNIRFYENIDTRE